MAKNAVLSGPIPAGHPSHLAITLWDFSWYTAAGPGEPYENLSAAFDGAESRGYNTIRICAAPMLLFGSEPSLAGPSRASVDSLARNLEIEGLGKTPLGGHYGAGTRWYNTPGGYSIDLQSRLLDLLRQASTRGMKVILSSWEFQQSPAFAADRQWHDYLQSFREKERLMRLAEAFDRMLTAVSEVGLSDVIAFVELHNEIDFSVVPKDHESLREAISFLKKRHPEHLITASYGKPPHLDMASVSEDLEVAQFHIYAYGVLDALQREIDIREDETADFPNAALRRLLRRDAPTPAEYGSPAPWKFEATVITSQMVYGYDWVDPELWDRWLYDHFGEYRLLMRREITSRLEAVAAWSRRQNIPFVVGESWVGYTPLHADFEDGSVGRSLAELGMECAFDLGAWGVTPSSNSAPHHPAWNLSDWQRQVNSCWH